MSDLESTSATRSISDAPTRAGWQAYGLAAVAAFSPTDPVFCLRGGAIVCAILFLSNVHGWRPKAPDLFALSLVVLTATSLLWTADSTITTLTLKNQIAVAVIFLAARSIVNSRWSILVVGWGYIIGCLRGVFLTFQQNSISKLSIEISDTRYGIAGLNFNYLAYALLAGAIVAVIVFQASPSKRAFILLAALAFVFYLGVVQNGTRGATIGFYALVFWVVVYRYHPRLGLACIYATALIFTIITTTGIASQELTSLAFSGARQSTDLSLRLSIWPIARQVIADHLILGSGAGAFQTLNPYGIGAHNAILQIGTGLGLLGIVVFVGCFVTSLISSKTFTSSSRRALLVGAFFAASAPIYLSGHWELSPAAWLVLAIYSRMDLLDDTTAQEEIPRVTSGAEQSSHAGTSTR